MAEMGCQLNRNAGSRDEACHVSARRENALQPCPVPGIIPFVRIKRKRWIPLIIKSTEFIKSAVKPMHYPDSDLPEIAFAGRSNVGKSSLINVLVNRKN